MASGRRGSDEGHRSAECVITIGRTAGSRSAHGAHRAMPVEHWDPATWRIVRREIRRRWRSGVGSDGLNRPVTNA
jgi:hypothetical protein